MNRPVFITALWLLTAGATVMAQEIQRGIQTVESEADDEPRLSAPESILNSSTGGVGTTPR